MFRRGALALVVGLVALLLTASAAAAAYPPVPGPAAPGSAGRVVAPVVRVQGAPATPQRALGRTGASSTGPLVVLAGASLVFGLVLVGAGRRRRLARVVPLNPTA